MDSLSFYFIEGLGHILDPLGYDHILFVITLCSGYAILDWKKILVLLSGFTLGHSLTLLISGMGIISLNRDLVELLIPITILIACLHNLARIRSGNRLSIWFAFLIVVVFGLIHGLGFSSFFKMMILQPGSAFLLPLLSFNLGIELGQIIIVILYYILDYVGSKIYSVNEKTSTITRNTVIGIIAIYLIITRIPW